MNNTILLILCSDILSHLIVFRVKDGDIKGIKIGNGVPRITHLQFADDSLFFCQANRRNCQALKDAFDIYEYYSGQKINTSKSMITFGSRVYGGNQLNLKRILDIPNHGGGGKYLGLPEQFGRKKKEMFTYIIDRVRNRTSHWSTRTLSPAGKEIMLKSVAVSMPVYAMSCFKLPKGITSDIESLLMNFWWERDNQHKKIPWIAWTKLQKSKKEGGLGFRDLEKFNDALLAKQAWRLIKFPDSLFAKVMKARYYRDDRLLDAKERKNQSYGWASLLVGLDLIKKGSRYIVGNGKTIRLGVDNVLAEHPPRPILPNSIQSDVTMESLIKKTGETRAWDTQQLNNLTNPDDFLATTNLYISQLETADSLIWHYTTSGEYSVKSGYWFLTHNPFDSDSAQNIPHGSVTLKNKIWKLNILPKIKHFLWRVVSRALPTTTRLQTRGMTISSTCPRCNQDDETIIHALFTCLFANMVWRMTNSFSSNLIQSSTDAECIIESLIDFSNQHHNRKDALSPFWLVWCIWKARNRLVFDGVREGATTTSLKALAETNDWICNVNQTGKKCNPTTTSNIPSWSPPIFPALKCNFDAAYDTSGHHTSGGWILRDHLGEPIVWGAMNLSRSDSALEAEAKALLSSLQLLWSRGYGTRVMIFEGDCVNLINMINGRFCNASLTNVLRDIQLWLSKFQNVSCIYTNRKNNESAHCLAKQGCETIDFYVESVLKPDWLIASLFTNFG